MGQPQKSMRKIYPAPATSVLRLPSEQIANRLQIDFPEDESVRISHEAIYQALDIQGQGALRRELVRFLRTGRALYFIFLTILVFHLQAYRTIMTPPTQSGSLHLHAIKRFKLSARQGEVVLIYGQQCSNY